MKGVPNFKRISAANSSASETLSMLGSVNVLSYKPKAAMLVASSATTGVGIE